MLKTIRNTLMLGGFALLTACASVPPAFETAWPEHAEQSAARMQADMATLASDAYEGRESGTPGYDKAVAYVSAAFADIGLTPAGDNGTWLQQVKLRRGTAVQAQSAFGLTGPRGAVTLKAYDDYIVGPSTYATATDVTGEIVFMGYGIDAPQFGQTAYRDVDVRGKIVAIIGGVPAGIPSEESAHFGGDSKVETAARYGAAGIVSLSLTRASTEQGKAGLAAFADSESDFVVHANGAAQTVDTFAFMTKQGTEKLLAAAGINPTEAMSGKMPARALGVSAQMKTVSTHEDYEAPNVIGVIPGSDPALKDEFVVLTAHLDHVGMEPEDPANPGADRIHNGAMDNSGGIATLLEEARKFMSEPTRPRRSIMFIALAAEEKGLLGSEFFVRQPTIPAAAMVANVNLDMPILLHDFTDVIAFGAEHSSLKGVTETAAATMGIKLSPDPVPQMVLFVRSDHYNFVKAGVPSVFLFLGFENGGQESFTNFMASHYHQVSDQIDLPIMYDVAAKFAELNFRITKAIANADAPPSWVEGDFFGELFGRDAP